MAVPLESLAWAGFNDIAELEVVAHEEESGLDTAVDFVLRGPARDIDAALAVAEFTAPTTPGISIYQPPLPGIDLTELTEPRSAEDRWESASGDIISRLVVRGGTGDGLELIHVWAFTT